MSRLIAIVLLSFTVSAFAADDTARTIAVSGEGFVETPPDKATLMLSIVARAANVADAQAEAADVTGKVLALTKDMNIPANRVDTTSASVRPDYRWNRDKEEQELLGYVAERQMRVEIRDLEQLGEVIERAVKAGVNQVSPPQLDSTRRRDAYRDALERAAEDARQNAARLAQTLGLTLGPAIQVDAGPMARPPMPVMRMQEAGVLAADMAAPATYNAGDMTVNATVSVVFELTE